MEKHITSDQERLQSLQEKDFFTHLNEEEQQFVLRHCTPEEFDNIHRILLESKDLYAAPIPKPLLIPTKEKSLMLRILLPLGTAVAASVLTFIFTQHEEVVFRNVKTTVYTAADTVYVHDTEIDTIVKIIHTRGKERLIEKQATGITVELSLPGTTTQALEPLSIVDLENKGESAAVDKTIALIEGVGL